MSKLPLVSSEKIVKCLLKAGFDHGDKFLVIIPKRDPIPKGTFISIIKQSGLSRDEFIKLLK